MPRRPPLLRLSGVDITTPDGKAADTLNADLVTGGAHNELEQKQVTAWLDLRNKAAHGHPQRVVALPGVPQRWQR